MGFFILQWKLGCFWLGKRRSTEGMRSPKVQKLKRLSESTKAHKPKCLAESTGCMRGTKAQRRKGVERSTRVQNGNTIEILREK